MGRGGKRLATSVVVMRPALVCLVVGGLPFSLFLYRLGIDIASPELLHSILIATLLLVILLGVTMLFWSPRRSVRVIVDSLGLAFLMCVPVEVGAYLSSNWSDRGPDLFSANNLPYFVCLLCVGCFRGAWVGRACLCI